MRAALAALATLALAAPAYAQDVDVSKVKIKTDELAPGTLG